MFQKVSAKIESLSDDKKTLIGLFLIFTSTLFFSLSNVMVKYISGRYSSFTIVFWRGWIGLVIIPLLARLHMKQLLGVNIKALLLRGFIGAITLILYFSAIKHTTLANSAGLFNTFPIFTPFIGVLFFKERWRYAYLFALIFALIGVWFVVRPNISTIGIGELFGLTSAFLAAWVVNLLRYLRKTDSVVSILFYFMIFTTILPLVPPGFKELTISFQGWYGLTLIAILSTFAQLLVTAGYTYCTATAGSIVSLFQLPITLFLSNLFLKEPLNISLGIGEALIFISGYLVTIPKKRIATHA
ncbi:MAG: DMT family transporter [Spirochaetota bacterium]|nr:MAG: DMT family transporter [Spirochaetota bacterium]